MGESKFYASQTFFLHLLLRHSSSVSHAAPVPWLDLSRHVFGGGPTQTLFGWQSALVLQVSGGGTLSTGGISIAVQCPIL